MLQRIELLLPLFLRHLVILLGEIEIARCDERLHGIRFRAEPPGIFHPAATETAADAGDVAEVWFSPPARMPVGLALGAVTIGRWLHLSFRYRHPLFGPGAAARFAARYVEALDRLAA